MIFWFLFLHLSITDHSSTTSLLPTSPSLHDSFTTSLIFSFYINAFPLPDLQIISTPRKANVPPRSKTLDNTNNENRIAPINPNILVGNSHYGVDTANFESLGTHVLRDAKIPSETSLEAVCFRCLPGQSRRKNINSKKLLRKIK